MMPDPDAPVPALRASDAERERTADVIRGAAADGRITVEELEARVSGAYSARTRAELVELTRDIDPHALSADAVHSAGDGGPVVRVKRGQGGSRRVLAVMSGSDRSGRWRVAERCTVLSVMGGSNVDLNDAELSAPVTQITAVSIMGGCEIRVPDGVRVHVSHVGIMGGNDIRLGDADPPADAPEINVRLISIMGGASVKRGRRPVRGRERRRRRRDLGADDSRSMPEESQAD